MKFGELQTLDAYYKALRTNFEGFRLYDQPVYIIETSPATCPEAVPDNPWLEVIYCAVLMPIYAAISTIAILVFS